MARSLAEEIRLGFANVIRTVTSSVSVVASVLPTGASTAAKQDTGNSSLSSIDGKTPALSSGRVPVDGSGVTQPVSASALPLPTGAATAALQTSLIAALGSPFQAGGSIGNAAFGVSASSSGGCLPYHVLSAASTNATVVKTSAGQLYMAIVRNNSGAVRKLAFHDTASAPTAGAGIYFTLQMSSGGAQNVYMFPVGVAFSSGIAFTTVTGIADADATAVGANELMIELFYK